MPGATDSSDAGSVLAALLLFGLLGLLGQGIRAVVGLKNAGALNTNTPSNQSVFSAAYLLVSLMIGFIAGTMAGIALRLQDLTKIDQSSWQELLGIMASGYVGADFVENTFNLIMQGTNPWSRRQPPLPLRREGPPLLRRRPSYRTWGCKLPAWLAKSTKFMPHCYRQFRERQQPN